MRTPVRLNMMGEEIGRLSFLTLPVLLVTTFLGGCNGDALLKDNGSYCSPPADSRTEDCFLDEPQNRYDDPGEITISDRGDLETICNATCDKIESLTVTRVNGLKDLRALNGIEVTERAFIERNPDLKTTKGLNLRNAAALDVVSNKSLTDVYGLSGVSIASSVSLRANSQLTKVHGLSSLERVYNEHEGEVLSSSFVINSGQISQLGDLDGLNLTRKSFLGLENLPNMTRLPRVQGQSTTIRINHNESLRNISGLTGIDKVITELEIRDNPKVKTCRAREIAEQIEYGEQRGDYEIVGNGSGTCD